MIDNVNFCELPVEQLNKLFIYLDVTEILDNSECEELFKSGKCIEKRWKWYDELIVKPKEILYSPSPYPTRVILTTDKFIKMQSIFNNEKI